MISIITAGFIPPGGHYGVQVTTVDLRITDILNTELANFTGDGINITSGVTYTGVKYSSAIDTTNVPGPYVTATWNATWVSGDPASGYVFDPVVTRVPLVPNNYQICIEFNNDVMSTSGTTLIDSDNSFCYGVVYSPFYVPIDLFRAETFDLFEEKSDLEIAYAIWNASRQVDAEVFCRIDATDYKYPYLQMAKRKYATLLPMLNQIRYIIATSGNVSKKLADFEIQIGRGTGSGSGGVLKDWLQELKDWKKVLNSCGDLTVGASVRPRVGRIGDDYDRTVFGRFFDNNLLNSIGYAGSVYRIGSSIDGYEAPVFYETPRSYNHLYTDPLSSLWVR